MGLSAEQYGEHILALLPRGRAWTREEGSVLRALAEGLGLELAAVDLRAETLRQEVDPFRTSALLADWERVLGLPDPCIGRVLTVDERRALVLARLAARGGQSRTFYQGLAASLGFEVQIVEHPIWRCTSRCDEPINTEEWAHTWSVRAPLDTITVFRCTSPCDQPLRSWGNDALECAIERVAPAHTHLLFEYIPDPEPQHLIWIYIDDPYPLQAYVDVLGWPEGEGEGYDHRFPQTPVIDSLIASGVRFRRAQTAPVCSPGRASFALGVHADQHGMGTVPTPELSDGLAEINDPGYEHPTLAEKLAAAATPPLIGRVGKVHLGLDGEDEGGSGFAIMDRLGPVTHYEVTRANHNNAPYPEGMDSGNYYAFKKSVNGALEDVLGDYSTKHWLERARAWVTQIPFTGSRVLLDVQLNAVHSPFDEPPPESVYTEWYLTGSPTAFKRQMAMMESTDFYLGQFLDSLPPEFLQSATIVLMADNGPDETVMRSGRDDHGMVYGETWDGLLDSSEKRVKGSLFREGILATMIVSGPGLHEPGRVSDEPVHVVDVHETVLRYFNVVDEARTDGVSLLGHLYQGTPIPRYRGAQFSAYYAPNGDHTTIEAAATTWSASVNYSPGTEVNHLGLVYGCLVASGPGNGGAIEPGSAGSATEWVRLRIRSYALEADITDSPGGPDFNGRFAILRKLGMPDRVWHLFRVDGSPVHPYQLPGEEIPPIGDNRLTSIATRMTAWLDEAIERYPGRRDCIEIRDENDVRATLSPTDGRFPIVSETGVQGWLAATFEDGDIPGRAVIRTEKDIDATLLLAACIPANNRLPILSETGAQGYQELNDSGGFDLFTESGILGSLLVGAGGVTITDEADQAGYLPLA